jgi:tRNA A37 threonylcarbamoyladenosine modification protein TsaB
MFLLINLSEKDKIHLVLFDKDSLQNRECDGRNRELLVSIDTFFNEQKFNKENLKGIMLVVSTGSFTNTRISAVVANTFSYVLDIPLLAIAKDEVDKVQDLIPKLLKQPKGQYVSATYSAEPNIG